MFPLWKVALLGFIVAVAGIFMFRPMAVKVGLVDRPGGRKLHLGSIPLVGGAALLCAVLIGWLTLRVSWPTWMPAYLLASIGIIATGILDDRYDLQRRLRIPAQIGCALLVILGGGLQLSSLGNLFGAGPVLLGGAAILFTVMCIVGVMNGANLLDGANGLASGVCLIAFLTFATAAGVVQAHGTQYALILLTGAIFGFLIFNFRFRRQPALAFLGDAGSLFLGLTLAVVAIYLSQRPEGNVPPMSAVWISGLLVLDTVSLMLRRMLRGKNPFSADRTHLHHLLIAAGMDERRTVITIWCVQIGFSLAGMAAWLNGVPEWVMFVAFVTMFVLYNIVVELGWAAVRRRDAALEAAEALAAQEESEQRLAA